MSIAVEGAVAGERVLWGAPTYDQVRICWDETRRAAGGVAVFTQQRMTAEFPSGGTIIYRSLDDPDNARGHTADGVVIDEVGDVAPSAFYEVLRPMLIDTSGWFWGEGTPRGRNWFWREWQNAQSREDSASWQVPTLGVAIEDGRLVRRPHPLENPQIPFTEIEQIWKTTPSRVFEQEILAQFVEDSGSVFRRVSELATAERQDGPTPDHEYIMGVDLARRVDFTVISILDISVTPAMQVCQDRFNQVDWSLQVGRIKALAERFQAGQVVVDQTGVGDPVVEQLQREITLAAVTGVQFTNANKANMVEALALAFEKGDIRILPDPVLIGELQAYEMERLPSGLMRYNAPQGMHDDTVMALALAWQGVAGMTWLVY